MSIVEKQNWHEGMTDRRSCIDRRRKRLSSIKELFKHRRRHHLRRKDDHRKIVLFDRYSNALIRIVIVVLLLSVCDAFFTIFLFSNGAVELNPIMAYYLNISPLTFLLVKYGLTALSVVTVVILHYTLIRCLGIQTRYLLHGFAAVFYLVVVWEVFLISSYYVRI